MMKRTLFFSGAFLVVVFCSDPAHAAVNFGVRAGVYVDGSDPYLGAEAIVPITGDWFFNPSVEHVFGDSNDDPTFLSADVHYDLAGRRARRMVWVGGGLALIFDNSDTKVGVDVLAGAGTRWKGMVPYVQAKGVIADNSSVLVGAGLRF